MLTRYTIKEQSEFIPKSNSLSLLSDKINLAGKFMGDSLEDKSCIEKAALRIAPYIRKTPLIRSDVLSDRFQSNFYVKLENLQTTGAFKVRGAFNKILSLTQAERKRGLVAVSGGNHAQAVAHAAKVLNCSAVILMPQFTQENYIRGTKKYGAEIVLTRSLKEGFEIAEEYKKIGFVNIPPFDDLSIIAGQGTIGLEIMEDLPQVTDVVVSIGGGGLAAGIATVLKNTNPGIRVWGVETLGAESMSKSLRAGKIVELSEITSIAKTLGATAVGRLTFELVKKYVDEVATVSDAEAVQEMFYLLDQTKVLTEPAASCTLALAEKIKRNFSRSDHVLLVLCGGNIGIDYLLKLRKLKANLTNNGN